MQKIILCCLFFCFVFFSAFSQDTSRPILSKGQLYGQVFGDYFYKVHADPLNRGHYQYSQLPDNSNAFQIRRVYLGYKYDISSRFTADILMESVGGNGSMDFFIKYANLQWKNIFPLADLVIGRMKTPTFSTVTDKVWNYRSIERTVSDMQGNPSYDLGVALWGHFDKNEKFGYNVMVGNGEGDRLTDNRFKKFYGEVYARLANKRLVFDLYADYERFHWQRAFHQSANMFKASVAYQSAKLTVGLEAYTQFLQQSVVQNEINFKDTVSARNFALSVFIHGKIWKDKLGFFVRLDHFDPFTNYQTSIKEWTSLMANYDALNRTRFITAGLDYSPIEKVHFMPNIWYGSYRGLLNQDRNYDLVYRLTFFYQFKG